MEAEGIEFPKKAIKIDPIFRARHFLFDRDLVFVIMPFSEPWSERIWKKLKTIVESMHLRAERGDEKYGAIVTEDIWRSIMECRLLLADLTGWNPNVFYELGVAHTIGKPVVLLTQPASRLPFDTQGLRLLLYTDDPDGMKKLEEELPRWIENCLYAPIVVGPASAALEKHKKQQQKEISKARIKEAWCSKTDFFDPPLPPINFPDLRSRLALIKLRMMEDALSFSAKIIERLVADLKQIWPRTWEGLTPEDIANRIDEIEEVAIKYRAENRKEKGR